MEKMSVQHLIFGAILLLTLGHIKLIQCNTKILSTTSKINDLINENININNLNNFNDNLDNNSMKSNNQNANGEIPIVRLPANPLLKYTAYKDVSILHFRIPEDTRTAYFSFKAFDEARGAFQRYCSNTNVSIHLKAGSYPVISPEKIAFPKHFYSAEQRFEIHTMDFHSDGVTRRLVVDSPHPGNWFGIAFIGWTDPKEDRIEQQGIAASCETLLSADMSVKMAEPIVLNDGNTHTSNLKSNQAEPISYKFFVPNNVAAISWYLTVQTCLKCLDLNINVQAASVPNDKNFIHNAIVNFKEASIIGGAQLSTADDAYLIKFQPLEQLWHYVDIDFLAEVNGSSSGSGGQVNPVEQHEITFDVRLEFHFLPAAEDEESALVESAKVDAAENVTAAGVIVTDGDLPLSSSGVPLSPKIEYHPLLRQTYREFFMYDYDLVPDANGTVSPVLNLTGDTISAFKFDVGGVYDIGGTLSFALAMKSSAARSQLLTTATAGETEAVAEKLVDNSKSAKDVGGAKQQLSHSNQTVIVCMRLNEPGVPEWPDKCVYGRNTFPAITIINNTDVDTSTGLVHVPFPETGRWFVTMRVFCHGAETAARTTIIDSVKEFIKQYSGRLEKMRAPCACAERADFYQTCIQDAKCLGQMNETETLKVKECIMDSKCTDDYQSMSRNFELHHKFATEQSVIQDGTCNTSIVFTISSSPCVAGRCGRFGRCFHYMSGGFVFSTCVCLKNYRGWDCSDDSQVPSTMSILTASLLLTLSNLLFIPSIFIAVKRGYYTEAVIYFFAMFFSSFYHACDSGEEEYSYCLAKIGVLQFADFYCGLLSIWVTLIAMANLRQTFVSLLHMFGSILLAFGTELNKQSLWVFLTPALTGICIITTSWGMRCRKTKKWFPSRQYLAVFLPLGCVLAMIGLACFGFLQTKQNYHIVHSIWHCVMAIAILLLLPNHKTFKPKC